MDWPTYRNLSQTMLRVKDGPNYVEFFTKHRGVTLGDRVSISMRIYPEWCLAFIAVTRMGATAVPP